MSAMKYSGKRKRSKTQAVANTDVRPWKIVYVILCLALIALTANQLFLIPQGRLAYGEDYVVFVSAVQVLDNMQNPYILENINQYTGGGGNLQFVYPPHTLYFFWILQFISLFQNIWIYYALLVVLLVISGYLLVTLDQKPHYLFLTTLLLTGFMSTFWNFITGNKDILFLLLFAIILTLWVKEKYWQSSIVIGLAAGFSLFAAPFAALYLAIKRPILNRLAFIALSIGVVATLFLVSYCINPTYLVSYIGVLLHGSSSPLYESGGWNTPTPYLMFKDILNSISPGNFLPWVTISCVYVGLILYATWNYYLKHNADTLKIYSLVMLSIFMILPRIKPYNFIILVIPLYFLFKDCSYRMKSLILGVISLPIFVWYSPVLSVSGRDSVPYIQVYSLILIFLVVILYDHLTFASNEKEKDGKTPHRDNAHTE